MKEQFLERIRSYIPEEFEAFMALQDREQLQGLRLNPKKTDRDWAEQNLPFLEKPSPFAKDTWYVSGRCGLHPGHIQGRFYMQEPSAGSVVESMNIQGDETILDLCAAPGSKSTQIAGKLKSGFLVSNEIDPKRCQVLLSNLERMGAEDFMVTNMDAGTLCSQLPEAFDKILVDAPCSGEGMMKKHEKAAEEWSMENIELCRNRQREILDHAIPSLKPGGELTYSTCTYAREENEEIAAWILENYPDLQQIPVEMEAGREGLPTPGMNASLVRRIFPMDGGEGHFIARFRKSGSREDVPSKIREFKNEKAEPQVESFLIEQTGEAYPYLRTVSGKDKKHVYGMHHPFWNLKKGKVIRQGVYIGDLVKNRFEPAHSFFMSGSAAEKGKQKTEVTLEQMDAFMHGEQLSVSAPSGYRSLTWQGIPFGFGKSSQGRITNKLPKGLRLLPASHVSLIVSGRKDDENE